MRKLVDALDYAHKRGVVHCDVKPANVMIDEAGEPLVMDFGLTVREDGAERKTQDGSIMGTPAYMAPEQAAGRIAEVGPAADQYSLGCVLFELLAGETPFSGPPQVQLLLHQTKDAPRLRKSLPRDLETICAKCLEKEPAKRYESCAALAADLRRWEEGVPILARRVGMGERLVKWARCNPAVAGLTAAVATVLLLAAIGATVLASWALREASRAEAKAGEAADEATKARAAETAAKDQEKQKQKELDRAEQLVYVSRIGEAQRFWQDGNVVAANDRLDACRWDLRGWEYDYQRRQVEGTPTTIWGHTQRVSSVSWSPDGRRLLGIDDKGKSIVWDAATGKRLADEKPSAESVSNTISSNGGWYAIPSGSVIEVRDLHFKPKYDF